MPWRPCIKEKTMLFHEIYGTYYQVTAAILRQAARGALTQKHLTEIIKEPKEISVQLQTVFDFFLFRRFGFMKRSGFYQCNDIQIINRCVSDRHKALFLYNIATSSSLLLETLCRSDGLQSSAIKPTGKSAISS